MPVENVFFKPAPHTPTPKSLKFGNQRNFHFVRRCNSGSLSHTLQICEIVLNFFLEALRDQSLMEIDWRGLQSQKLDIPNKVFG